MPLIAILAQRVALSSQHCQIQIPVVPEKNAIDSHHGQPANFFASDQTLREDFVLMVFKLHSPNFPYWI